MLRTVPAGMLVSTLVAASLLAGCMAPSGGDLELRIGSMMPLTGELSSLGPSMERGVRLAAEHINAAGMGIRVTVEYKDDQTDAPTHAVNTFEQLVAAGVTGVVGPCCSTPTEAVLQKAIESEVVLSSPSATSPKIVERDPMGYFLRISPSDALQGRVLARLVKENNVTSVAIIAVNNGYGVGLTNVFKDAYTSSLGGVVSKTEYHEPSATTYSSQVDAACATPRPQGIVMVTYIAHGAAILKELQAKGCLGSVKVFGSEGVYDAALATDAGKDPSGKWLAEGVRGTRPEGGDLTRYNTAYNAKFGEDPKLYSAESYDATMYIGLAALKAKSTAGADIARALVDIANRPGTDVDDFKEAAQIIQDGDDINWVGMAHDFDFDDKHEPKEGVYSFWQVKSDGSLEVYSTGQRA